MATFKELSSLASESPSQADINELPRVSLTHQDSVEAWPEYPEHDRSQDRKNVGRVSGPFGLLRDGVAPFPVTDDAGGQPEVGSEDVDEDGAA